MSGSGGGGGGFSFGGVPVSPTLGRLGRSVVVVAVNRAWMVTLGWLPDGVDTPELLVGVSEVAPECPAEQVDAIGSLQVEELVRDMQAEARDRGWETADLFWSCAPRDGEGS
jgi:hypothetical protein